MFFLDNKTYIATNISPESKAYKEGLKEGNSIIKWNGNDINDEIKRLKYLNVSIPNISIKNVLNYYLPFYLSVTGDEENEITFINEEGKTQVINIKSIDNGYKYLKENIETFTKKNAEKNFTYKLINNTAYLKITNEKDKVKDVKKSMNKIVGNINKDNAKNLIIDLRNNEGGSDKISSLITSYFTNKKTLYLKESILKNNNYKNINEIIVNGNNKINLPAIILVNGNTISAGEIIAYNLRKFENIKVAGLTSTNGSIATVKKRIIMPENILVSIPSIACKDENNRVIIDSDSNKDGGVKLDIKIPINKETITKIFNKKIDYEMEYMLNYLNKEKKS